MHQVEFLAVVLVALKRGIGVHACCGGLAEGSTKGIVVGDLFQRAALIDHLAVIAQVVLIVVVPRHSGIAAAVPQRAVAAGEQVLCRHAVLHDKVAEIIYRVLRQNFSGRQLVSLSAPNGDAWHGGVINGAQFPPRGRIDIFCDVTVGELYAAGHTAVIIGDEHDAFARVGDERSVGIVMVCAAVRAVAMEVEGSVVEQFLGIVTDIVEAVALDGDVQVIHLAVLSVVLHAAPLQAFCGSALVILQNLLVEIVLVITERVAFPVDAFRETVQRIVCELVAALLDIVSVAPLLHADVAVVAGRARTVPVSGIVEFFPETGCGDIVNPSVEVVFITDRTRAAGTGYGRNLSKVIIGDVLDGARRRRLTAVDAHLQTDGVELVISGIVGVGGMGDERRALATAEEPVVRSPRIVCESIGRGLDFSQGSIGGGTARLHHTTFVVVKVDCAYKASIRGGRDTARG